MALRANERINVVKYYGSKAMMFQDVIDRLDYDNTKVYLEIFGGGASVLLNKPKHDIEIYNELNFGMYTLFSVLSNYERGIELRERLKEVQYTKESFQKALEYKNAFEDDAQKENERKLRQFITEIEKKHNLDNFREYKRYYLDYCKKHCEKYNTKECTKANCNKRNRIDEKIDKTLKSTSLTVEEKKRARKLVKEYQEIKKGIFRNKKIEEYKEGEENKEIDVAMATFIVQNMSRDGMGKHFANMEKGESNFQNKVYNLIDAIDRLRDVIVICENARDLISRENLNKVLMEKGVDIQNIPDWQLMYYVDAPYLEEITVTLEKRERGINAGNPGKLYKSGGFSYVEHAMLLNEMKEHEAKFLVSNYRDAEFYYDTYLNAGAGWRYTEYPTKTTVGGAGRERTEILWQNY